METNSHHIDHEDDRWMRRGLPPWPTLVSFIEVVRCRSVTRTAERLHLTQSAVSHQIAQLERFVGGPLFERSGKALRPTAQALELADNLRRHLEALSVTVEEAREGADKPDLHVVVAPELHRHWLAPRLDTFLLSQPQVSLRISQDYRRDAVLDGGADFQIRLGRPLEGEEGFPLAHDEELVVCSSGLATQLPANEAFRAAPFLSHAEAHGATPDWRRWMLELHGVGGEAWIGDRLENVIMFASFEAMLEACRQGRGFALLRTILASDDLASGRLVAPINERLPADANYHVLHKANVALRPIARSFVTWLRNEVEASGKGSTTK